MIKVNAKYVKALYPFKADKDVRYYLEGIHISPHQAGGAVLRAMNGHVAGIIYDKSAVCDESILLKLNRSALQHCTSREGDRFLVVDGKRASICDKANKEYYLQPNDCRLDGKYPSFDKLIPDNLVPGAPSQYSPEYFEILSNRLGSRYSALSFFHLPDSPRSALIVRNSAMPELIALLMPMKMEAIESVPAWWKTYLQAEPVTA
jgi:hypothetical protein